jgi:aryl-alcohol dehydrogenase-like predicted oxidoreductase
LFDKETEERFVEFRTLKQTDLEVSRLCFGSMTFGLPVAQAEATAMFDVCLQSGINFFDTANIYQLGQAEEMLGHAMKGRRGQVILSSKVRADMGEGDDEKGLSKRAILRAIEDSLRRLQTDYLDIYFLHQPDYSVPVEESLEAMEQLVRQGKVRFGGTSNYSSWQVGQILSIGVNKGFTPAATAQLMYNLLARGIEQEFVPMARELAVSIIAYNPLAAGLLTGKHRQSTIPQGGRFDGNSMYQDRYWHTRTFQSVEKLKTMAEESGRSLISMAFAWLLHHTIVDCVVLGASNLEQLQQNLLVCDDGPLPDEIVQGCDQIWNELRGPVPSYNR